MSQPEQLSGDNAFELAKSRFDITLALAEVALTTMTHEEHNKLREYGPFEAPEGVSIVVTPKEGFGTMLIGLRNDDGSYSGVVVGAGALRSEIVEANSYLGTDGSQMPVVRAKILECDQDLTTLGRIWVASADRTVKMLYKPTENDTRLMLDETVEETFSFTK